MKILFTADPHSHIEAYRRFASILDSKDFDVGIIAGDLTEGWIPYETLVSTFGEIAEDDFVPELYGPDDTEKAADIWSRKVEALLQRGLRTEEKELKKVLKSTKKPILIIRGNHDRTFWKSEANIHNIHKRCVRLGEIRFIGLEQTKMYHATRFYSRHLQRFRKLIDQDTILVTHFPPLTILDLNGQEEHIGSEDLLDVVRSMNFKFHLFGHVHESFGVRSKYINGSFPIAMKFISIDTKSNSVELIEAKLGDTEVNQSRYSEMYIELINLIKQQRWASLINWNIVNTGMNQLWIYDHDSEMKDGESIIIVPVSEDLYSISDIKLDKHNGGTEQEILHHLHDYLVARHSLAR